jgi:hypothetical protein
MRMESFQKLLGYVLPRLTKSNRRLSIVPEVYLLATLRYLAGGSYGDICDSLRISWKSFYRVVFSVIRIICTLPQLDIKQPGTANEYATIAEKYKARSTNGILHGCCGALDGWLCEINAPKKEEVDDVKKYHSGHYSCYGVNVQAVCDSDYQFTFLACSEPGSVNDIKGYRDCGLQDWVTRLPLGYYIVADAAYKNTNQLLTPYFGVHKDVDDPWQSSFNFHLSQLQISIEQAFSILVGKWQIFCSPLMVKFKRVALVITCSARLHNFCIDERIGQRDCFQRPIPFHLRDNPTEDDNVIGYHPSTDERHHSTNRIHRANQVRSMILNDLKRNGQTRPQQNGPRCRPKVITAIGLDEDVAY